MNDDISGGTSKRGPKTDWDRVRRTTDADVHAAVARDPDVRPTDEAFWKDAHDPRIRVIRVTPEKGQYWEGAGLVAGVASMLIAGAKGARPKLGENAKVEMG